MPFRKAGSPKVNVSMPLSEGTVPRDINSEKELSTYNSLPLFNWLKYNAVAATMDIGAWIDDCNVDIVRLP